LREPSNIDALLLADRDQSADLSVVIDLLPYSRGGGRGGVFNAGKGHGLDQEEADAKRDCKESLSHLILMTLYQRLSRELQYAGTWAC
jgi:hypothetical protein